MAQSVRDQYSEDDVTMWLINPEDGLDDAHSFVGDTGLQLPVLFDPGGVHYRSYPFGIDDPYAPFPVHVVIDQQGVIRYLAFQNDVTSLRAVVDGLLAGE